MCRSVKSIQKTQDVKLLKTFVNWQNKMEKEGSLNFGPIIKTNLLKSPWKNFRSTLPFS